MSRERRLSPLHTSPRIATIDHRHLLNEEGKLRCLHDLPRSSRRKIAAESKQLGKKYFKVLKKIMQGGAGFQIDRFIRERLLEYTDRYASSGYHNQPASFNYFEAFGEITFIENSLAPYIRPRHELSHMFDMNDYLDYLTSSESDGFQLDELMLLEEGHAFHYTPAGSMNDFVYTTAGGKDFLFAGFAMVRHEGSVHWCIVGGEILDDHEWNNLGTEFDVETAPMHKRAFLADRIKATGPLTGGPVPLDGTLRAVRTALAGEIDIASQKHITRCRMIELQNTFLLHCDDPDTWSHMPDGAEKTKRIKYMSSLLNESAVMWNLAESLLHIDRYFRYRKTISSSTVHSSRIGTPKGIKGGEGIGACYKYVPSLETTDGESRQFRSYTPRRYEVETQGHWRFLADPLSQGYDRSGTPVRGKTWVASDVEWRSRQGEERTIYVKTPLAFAKITIDDYIRAAKISGDETTWKASPTGVIYVMRCAAMEGEIYKVGYTARTAEERAAELSSSTSCPTPFVVVQYWPFQNPKHLETSVHAALMPYRINNTREFFRTSFQNIKAAIEAEIGRAKLVGS